MFTARQPRILSAMLLVSALSATFGCESAGKRTAVGATIGTVGGALAGAAIGAHSGGGNDGTILAGALIGAAAGGALGGGIGYYMDKQAAKFEEIPNVEVQNIPAQQVETTTGYVEQPEHLKLTVNSELLFERGSSSLSAEGSRKVAEMAGVMRDYPDTHVIIKGYASSDGDDISNLNLSQRRAEMIAKTLIANQVAPERIQALGMGESNPVASNDTETGRMQNRRVEINIFPSGDVK